MVKISKYIGPSVLSRSINPGLRVENKYNFQQENIGCPKSAIVQTSRRSA